jgi:hypothetical protein
MSEPEHEDGEPDSRRPAVIGLVLVLLLVVAGYFLVTALRRNADLEDCLMSGRRNCAPIETPARGGSDRPGTAATPEVPAASG